MNQNSSPFRHLTNARWRARVNKRACMCIRIWTSDCAIMSYQNASSKNRMLNEYNDYGSFSLLLLHSCLINTGNEHVTKKRNRIEEKKTRIKWDMFKEYGCSSMAIPSKRRILTRSHACCKCLFDGSDCFFFFWIIVHSLCFIFTRRCAHRSRFQYICREEKEAKAQIVILLLRQ